MRLEYSGGCFCGALRYEARGQARHECFCHCESCRRAAGATPVAWVTFDAAAFTVRSGHLTTYESSPKVTRGFCRICGTTMTYQHADRADEIDVALATLEDPSDLAPKRHIWIQDKPAWVQIDDGLPQFETVSGPSQGETTS